MITDKSLRFLKTQDGIDFYRFHARLFHYFYIPMAEYEGLRSRMIRETIDLLRGRYRVIYMAMGDQIIGYGIITRGGGRNRFCTRRDAVLCSLYVDPSQRGKGCGRTLVRVLSQLAGVWAKGLYEYVKPDNLPSVRAAEANGFRKIGTAAFFGRLKLIKPDPQGPLHIYWKDPAQ